MKYTEEIMWTTAIVFLVIGSAGNIGAQSVKKLDSGDLDRQNKITQEILAKYLQRRLFSHLLNTRAQSVPVGNSRQQRARTHTRADTDQDDGLETVESERIPNFQFIEDDLQGECTNSNCIDDSVSNPPANRWSMPLLKSGEKRYYLGIFFKANWYRAAQYCRYHGMHLASISSQEENDRLEKHIRDFGLGHEHFWTSGTDQAEEGSFFWMSTGRPVTFTNWNTGEPNNFRYENGEEEHCLELWNRDGKGLKWNDTPCSFETFFVCEVWNTQSESFCQATLVTSSVTIDDNDDRKKLLVCENKFPSLVATRFRDLSERNKTQVRSVYLWKRVSDNEKRVLKKISK